MTKYLLVACMLALGIAPIYAEEEAEVAAVQQKEEAEIAAVQHRNTNMQQSGQIKWYTNYNEAVSVAKKSNKPLLLFFTGSDWCGWCKKMQQEVFDSPDFASAAGNDFVFVEIDFPMNKPLPPAQQQENNKLKQKYGITGYPTIVILDPSGNFVAETGYRPGGGKAYADYLKQLMK